MENNSFAGRLQSVRKKRGYTQEQLAEITGISIGSIRRYEQNRNNEYPNAVYLLYLAEALDVTPEYLLNGEEKMNNYTNAIMSELKQIDSLERIKEIKAKELDSKILSHLELSEKLVTEIKQAWEAKRIFNDSYCTRNYVREVILRYCQNRFEFRTKFEINDDMLLNI